MTDSDIEGVDAFTFLEELQEKLENERWYHKTWRSIRYAPRRLWRKWRGRRFDRLDNPKWAYSDRNPVFNGWWSFNYALARVAIPALEKMRDDGHGFPDGGGIPGTQAIAWVLSDDAGGMTEDEKRQAELDMRAEWRSTLDEMIDGFKAFLELDDLHYDGDWDQYMAARDAVKDRMVNGLTLLAENFDDLWD